MRDFFSKARKTHMTIVVQYTTIYQFFRHLHFPLFLIICCPLKR